MFSIRKKFSSSLLSLLGTSQGGAIDGLYTAVDCGSTSCEAIYEVLETCIVYSEPQIPTALCVIPCELSGCDQHVYHYVNCAVWTCTDKTTPKPPVTTSHPPAPSSCKSSVCISSVSVNAIFGIALVALMAHFGRKAWLRRNQAENYASVESAPLLPSAPPLQADNSGFHEVPLIPRPDVSPPAAREHIPLRCFDSLKKFWARRTAAGTAAATDESSI